MKTFWFMKFFFFLTLLSTFFAQQLCGQPEIKTIDKSLYRLLIEHITPNGLWENRINSIHVRVDPRPVKGTPTYVENLSFAQLDETELDQHIQLIAELGAIPADIEEDKICLFTGGLPPPPRPGEVYEKREIPEHCKEIGNFVTIFFALPRSVEGTTPDEEGGKIAQRQYIVRAVEISSYTLGVYDLVFDLEENHRWEFIKKEQIFMVMS